MRPIDADAICKNCRDRHGKTDCFCMLAGAPTLTLDDLRPKGRWDPDWWRPKCSLCGFQGSVFDVPVNPFNYCPNCGAKMVNGEADA